MAYPTGTPVEEAILDNIETTLAAIATPSYKTTVRRVDRIKPLGYALQEFPSIIIGVPTVTWSPVVTSRIEGELKVTVRGAVEDRETGFQTIHDLAADIRQALLTDTSRNTLACWTRIETQEPFLAVEEAGQVVFVDLAVRVLFRHLYDDPNTAA